MSKPNEGSFTANVVTIALAVAAIGYGAPDEIITAAVSFMLGSVALTVLSFLWWMVR